MLDRSLAPAIQEINQLRLPHPEITFLDNGIPVYQINMGTQDIVKIEVVFNAGRPFESQKLAARTTAALLKEGTTKLSASEIAETIDFYGGTLSIPVNLDTSNVILYSLTKHLDKLLPLLSDILQDPAFPEAELKAFKDRNKQRLQVDLTRNDVVAYRKITEFIFGEEHPYGYNSNNKVYDELKRTHLIEHFQKNYIAENCKIFISGKIDEHTLTLINQHLGKKIVSGKMSTPYLKESKNPPKSIFIENPDSVQTAIRIGCQLFNRKHPDFKDLFILNTILGGYFGSRLMTNIREDKGYTYNIFSTLDAMHFGGCFYVGTEVGNEFVEATKQQIYKEFQVLQQDLLQETELQMVKNYLLGNLLTMLDGAFNVADVIKTMILEGLPHQDFHHLVQRIKQVEADELQVLAKKYLRKEQMWEVTVGK